MIINLDPTWVSWLIILAASFCTFKLGTIWSHRSNDEVIEETIVYLIENNFVKAQMVDGDWELIDLDGNK